MKGMDRGTIRRDGWPSGPWDDEPDKERWRDPETGLPCLILRSSYGHLCGYVGVAEGHQAYGMKYHDVYGLFPERGEPGHLAVHGGLTFSDGDPDGVWWLGFDCSHAYDVCPGLRPGLPGTTIPSSAYRDWAYVRGEVSKLALALGSLAGNGAEEETEPAGPSRGEVREAAIRALALSLAEEDSDAAWTLVRLDLVLPGIQRERGDGGVTLYARRDLASFLLREDEE